MPTYFDFMMRHGEAGVQGLIEQIERVEGIRNTDALPLEDRWKALMCNSFAPENVGSHERQANHFS